MTGDAVCDAYMYNKRVRQHRSPTKSRKMDLSCRLRCVSPVVSSPVFGSVLAEVPAGARCGTNENYGTRYLMGEEEEEKRGEEKRAGHVDAESNRCGYRTNAFE